MGWFQPVTHRRMKYNNNNAYVRTHSKYIHQSFFQQAVILVWRSFRAVRPWNPWQWWGKACWVCLWEPGNHMAYAFWFGTMHIPGSCQCTAVKASVDAWCIWSRLFVIWSVISAVMLAVVSHMEDSSSLMPDEIHTVAFPTGHRN